MRLHQFTFYYLFFNPFYSMKRFKTLALVAVSVMLFAACTQSGDTTTTGADTTTPTVDSGTTTDTGSATTGTDTAATEEAAKTTEGEAAKSN